SDCQCPGPARATADRADTSDRYRLHEAGKRRADHRAGGEAAFASEDSLPGYFRGSTGLGEVGSVQPNFVESGAQPGRLLILLDPRPGGNGPAGLTAADLRHTG